MVIINILLEIKWENLVQAYSKKKNRCMGSNIINWKLSIKFYSNQLSTIQSIHNDNLYKKQN